MSCFPHGGRRHAHPKCRRFFFVPFINLLVTHGKVVSLQCAAARSCLRASCSRREGATTRHSSSVAIGQNALAFAAYQPSEASLCVHRCGYLSLATMAYRDLLLSDRSSMCVPSCAPTASPSHLLSIWLQLPLYISFRGAHRRTCLDRHVWRFVPKLFQIDCGGVHQLRILCDRCVGRGNVCAKSSRQRRPRAR